jgi:enterochelin esterase-like enzyme
MSDGKFEEHLLTSAKLPLARKVWTQQSPFGSEKSAIIFLDGELYIMGVQAAGVVRELQEAGRIPPTLAVYVGNDGSAARHTDYTCNAAYASFICEEVLSWVLSTFPEIAPDEIVIAGLSLSGLCAAFLAVRFPDCPRAVICQSPSLWWGNERFKEMVSPVPARSPGIWISVGDQETQKDVAHPPTGLRQKSSQIEACERASEMLRSQGYSINYRMFQGGHDPQCWRDDLVLAIQWACASPKTRA